MEIEVYDPITFDDRRDNPNQSDILAIILEDERRKRMTWTMRRLDLKWKICTEQEELLENFFVYVNFLVFAIEVGNEATNGISSCISSYLDTSKREQEYDKYKIGDCVTIKREDGYCYRGTITHLEGEDYYKVKVLGMRNHANVWNLNPTQSVHAKEIKHKTKTKFNFIGAKRLENANNFNNIMEPSEVNNNDHRIRYRSFFLQYDMEIELTPDGDQDLADTQMET